MGNRTNLYIVCAFLFPLAFAAFIVGFGCPVWQAVGDTNSGLWQQCLESVFKNCSTLDFNSGGDWMIGVRAVEIFALVMFVAAAVDIIYENCCTNFHGRPRADRLASGITCILGGLGGVAAVIVYVVKTTDLPDGVDYGWAFALNAGGSALGTILGVGFFISGLCLENKRKKDHPKSQINGRTPHITSNNENYELTSYGTKNAYDDDRMQRPSEDNLPGFAIYNGLLNANGPSGPPGGGMRNNSLPLGVTNISTLPTQSNLNARGLPPIQPKNPQYYSLSDDRVLDPSFDLSEGFSYLPPKGRTSVRGQDNPAFARDPRDPSFPRGARGEDPYSRGGRGDDPYSRGMREENPYSREIRGEDPYSRGIRGEDPYSRGIRGEDPYSRGNRGDDPYSRGGRGEDPYNRGARAEDPYIRGAGREEDPYNRTDRAPPRAGYNDPFGFDRMPGRRPGGDPGMDGLYDRANYGRPNGQPMQDSRYIGNRF